ncbi:MAG: queuosine precursor transporter [Rubellimicrobium sp.]|nr:queuosine precursor transporter [Rubellimicrobium sp.]
MRLLPGILAMTVIVVASNVLVQFLLLDGLLTWGAFTYPFAFLVTEIVNRLHGTAAARRVVLAGFATGIACSLIGTQVMLESGPAVSLRIAVGSAAAFLAAQSFDILVFNRLRGRSWWIAPLVASAASSVVDTAVFFSTAFSATLAPLFPLAAREAVVWAQEGAPLLAFGPQAPMWVSLGLADLGVKLGIALVALVPFRLMVARAFRMRAAGGKFI